MPQGRFSRSGKIPRKWVIIGGLIILLLAIPIGFVIYQRISVPDIGEPFDVRAFLDFEVPDAENAFTYYHDAAGKLQGRGGDEGMLSAQDPQRGKAFSESLQHAQTDGWEAANEDVRAWLETNRDALDTWLEATELEQALEVHPRHVTIATLLTATQSCREFARLALLTGDRAAVGGDQEEAWKWYAATLRCSRHMGMHAPMIGRLVGVALHATSVQAIVRWSGRPDVTADQLRRALADVRAIDAMTPPLGDSIKCEYIVTSGSLRQIFAANHMILYSISGEEERVRRLIDLCYANWLSQYGLPRRQRTALRPGLLGLFEIGPGQENDPKLYSPAEIEQWSQKGLLGGSLIQQLSPAIQQFDIALTREEVKQRALELALALQIYHRQQGQFPESLDALVGEFFEEVPADPYGKGEPLHYRVIDEPEGGAIIWSVYVDGIDQGGEEPAERTEQPRDIVVRVRPPAAPER